MKQSVEVLQSLQEQLGFADLQKFGETSDVILDWNWTEKQRRFIESKVPHLAFIGGWGCGKTSALCRRALNLSIAYPGNIGLLGRFSYGEIEDSLLKTFQKVVHPDLIKHHYRDRSGWTYIINTSAEPSTIIFRNLDEPRKYEGVELGFFGISQANEPGITRGIWDILCGRLRWHKSRKFFAFMEGNYGGNATIGGWIHDIFVKDKKPDDKDYIIIEGNSFENEANLPAEYISNLKKLPYVLQEAYVIGSWLPVADFEGKPIYQEFKWQQHITTEFNYNPALPLYRGHDLPGPPACVWLQFIDGKIYILHELCYDSAVSLEEYVRQVEMETSVKFPKHSLIIDILDPKSRSTEQVAQQSIWGYLASPLVGWRLGYGKPDIYNRIQAVKKWLLREDCFKVYKDCLRLIGGFQGGYCLKSYKKGGIPEIKPDKTNIYSHIHDALQYVLTRLENVDIHYDMRTKEGLDKIDMEKIWSKGYLGRL